MATCPFSSALLTIQSQSWEDGEETLAADAISAAKRISSKTRREYRRQHQVIILPFLPKDLYHPENCDKRPSYFLRCC